MVYICRRLGQVDFIIRDRFCNHLSLVTLHLKRIVCLVSQTTTLFRGFESVFEAVDLASFSLSMPNHLRADWIDVHELLTASGITFLRTSAHRFIIAHGRQALIGNPS